jgi:excisionase family DNA binding protein
MTTATACECLTVCAVAEVLAVGAAHVRRLMKARRLHGVRVGKRQWRIPAASLETFLGGERAGRTATGAASARAAPC